MRVYTASEARQRLAAVLDLAWRDGVVQIKRRDGQVFLIQPEHSLPSPFDVDGLLTGRSTDDIANVIRERGEHLNAPQPKKKKVVRGTARKRAKRIRR